MLRIYVGGLGLNVREDDLRKTFDSPQLGSVKSVEIIRTKGRSFAYLDFAPASDKGLAKLFSTYNGCMWKGGRLKLEKAKEHYLSRLQHEWEEEKEEAKLSSKLSAQNDVADEGISLKPKIDRDMEKVNLNIFFPKLRKIKPLPLKGSGKHKYSFQRVEVPPFPVNFCDCEEHSAPLESVVRTRTANGNPEEEETCGVNEEEINMMKSILGKILRNDKPAKAVSKIDELPEETEFDAASGDQWQVEDFAEDQDSDEDNLVINIVGQPAKKQNRLSKAVELLSKSSQEIHGNQKHIKAPSNRKRKLPEPINNNTDDATTSKRKAKKKPSEHTDNPFGEKKNNQQQVDMKPVDDELGSSKKSSWKDLVKEKESSTFHISDILSNPSPQAQESKHTNADIFNEEETPSKEVAQSKKSRDLKDAKNNALPSSSSTDDRYARGASWLKKSSWLQLIADANKSAFSNTEVLPNATFQSQELQGSKNQSETVLNSSEKAFVSLDSQEEPHIETEQVEEKEKENEGGIDVIMAQSNELTKEEALVVGRGIVISETCPFMRSAASMREWAKAKAALSGSNRSKRKGKEQKHAD